MKFTLSILVCFLFISLSYGKIYDPKIVEMNEKFKNDVSYSLGNYLGHHKFNVFVNVQLNEKIKRSTNRQISIGYLNMPLMDKGDQKIEIKNIIVKVQLKDNLKDYSTLKNIVVTTLSGFNVKVSVESILLELKNKSRKPANATEAGPITEKSNDEIIKEDSILEKNLPLIVDLCVKLFLGLLGFLALIYFSRKFKSSFDNVSDALLTLKANTKNSVSSPKKNEPLIDTTSVDSAMLEEQKQAYLQTVTEVILKSKTTFLASIESNDYRGIKVLLPYLVSKLGGDIGGVFTTDILNKIEASEQKSMSNKQFVAWLSIFSEKVSLTHLKNQVGIINDIEKSNRDKLFAFSFDELWGGIDKLDESYGFKLLFSILPATECEKVIERFSTNQWTKLFATSETSKEQTNAFVKKLITVINESKSKDDDQFDLFLKPIGDFLTNRPSGSENELLEKIKELSPSFAAKIELNFWTSKKLLEIPKKYLAKFISELNTESRYYLLSGVDDDLREYLLKLIPSGRGRLVLEDQVSKKIKNNDKDENLICHNFVKQMIISLKSNYENGVFELSEDSDDLTLAA